MGPSQAATQPDPGGSVRYFDLTAASADVELRPGLVEHAWVYNGQVPGPLIRARAGDLVRVTLHNRLPVGTSIHWHGLQVPNGQDGVAGLTQEAVPAGATATYSFVVRTPGTYWYHSHDHGAQQVDRGLYGPLVVDPAGPTAADAVLVYDEWPFGLSTQRVPPAGDFNLESYTTYSVNGKAGEAIAPVIFAPGVPLRVRLVNAGYLVHFVHFDRPVTLVALDGREVTGAAPTSGVIPLGPGERVDVTLRADAQTQVQLEDGTPPADSTVVPLVPAGRPPARVLADPGRDPVLDVLRYAATATPVWPAGARATRVYSLLLDASPMAQMPAMRGMTSMDGMAYTINGRTFPNMPVLDVTRGDLVELDLDNRSGMDHAIHLHGHSFQVLAVDGAAPPGIVVKDTVVVRAGHRVNVGFLADNPGWWMLHCHTLYHSAAGMMTILRYTGTPRLAALGGPYDSVPD